MKEIRKIQDLQIEIKYQFQQFLDAWEEKTLCIVDEELSQIKLAEDDLLQYFLKTGENELWCVDKHTKKGNYFSPSEIEVNILRNIANNLPNIMEGYKEKIRKCQEKIKKEIENVETILKELEEKNEK